MQVESMIRSHERMVVHAVINLLFRGGAHDVIPRDSFGGDGQGVIRVRFK